MKTMIVADFSTMRSALLQLVGICLIIAVFMGCARAKASVSFMPMPRDNSLTFFLGGSPKVPRSWLKRDASHVA